MLESWGAESNLTAHRNGPAQRIFSLNNGWLFGGKIDADAQKSELDDAAFSPITLPHCVVPLSWQNWDAAAWENVWLYRRRFSTPEEFVNRRVFLRFDGVMVTAHASMNGAALPSHRGGYLPFTYELTSLLKQGGNILDLTVDSRFQNVPPEGSPRGTHAVDYYLPGGVIRGASLYAVPQVFISDVFAKPVDVLKSTRRIEITCSIDAAVAPAKPIHLEVKLMDGSRVVSSVRKSAVLARPGKTDCGVDLVEVGRNQALGCGCAAPLQPGDHALCGR